MKQELIGFIVTNIYQIYASTFRYVTHFETQEGRSLILEDIAVNGPTNGKSYIYGFWHQDETSFINYFKEKQVYVMVSHSKDGQIINKLVHMLGFKTVRGSSSRGGMRAFLEAIKVVKAGYKFSFAIDGPRGPIHKVKDGIIKLSEKTDRPIVAMRSCPDKYFQFYKSWNKAKVPKPFSKVHLYFADPRMYTNQELEDKINSFRNS